jgi:hypothetical protein
MILKIQAATDMSDLKNIVQEIRNKKSLKKSNEEYILESLREHYE